MTAPENQMLTDAAEVERQLLCGDSSFAFVRATEDLWLALIESRPDLRLHIAFNKTTTEPVLMRLAQDPDPRVRNRIAMTRRLTLPIFQMLARDASEDIRGTVVFNPKLPDEVKAVLRRDPSAWVHRCVRQSQWGSPEQFGDP